jgi:hypothetical protein
VEPTVLIAAGIVIAASLGFVAVGAVCRWDLKDPRYGRWTRLVGVAALLGLAAVSAWAYRDEPLVALAILGGGAAASALFVWAHKRLSAKVRDVLP